MELSDKQIKPNQLPETLPIFPLRNALLLPDGRLPLNIFEPRYLVMTDDVLGAGRWLGLVRPKSDDDVETLYSVGCAGKVISFLETDDGRYLVTLSGVSRFLIRTEIKTEKPYRLAQPDWDAFSHDLNAKSEKTSPSVRENLLFVLENYLSEVGLKADWGAIKEASVNSIVTSIGMSCPFSADEQQALLEATTIEERAKTLISLMEIAAAENNFDLSGTKPNTDKIQ